MKSYWARCAYLPTQFPRLASTSRDYPVAAPSSRNHPVVVPSSGNYPVAAPTSGEYPVAAPSSRNYPVAARSFGEYPVAFNAISLPKSQVVFPGEFLQISLPKTLPQAGYISVSPSFLKAYDSPQWNPQVCEILNGHALYKNVSSSPLIAEKHTHFRPHSVLISSLTDPVHDSTSAPPTRISGKFNTNNSSIVGPN